MNERHSENETTILPVMPPPLPQLITKAFGINDMIRYATIIN